MENPFKSKRKETISFASISPLPKHDYTSISLILDSFCELYKVCGTENKSLNKVFEAFFIYKGSMNVKDTFRL